MAKRTRTGGIAIARRDELGGFLRSRRARLTPEDVGLPHGFRRRTPGLRREEVAQIAGVGITWYTWLEQGREISVSRQVLEAIGRALRLDAAEQVHLHTLAGLDLEPEHHGSDRVPYPVQEMLDQLDPCPAYVVNARYDVLAWNRAEAALVGDFGLRPPEDRNVLWLMFTDPTWRALIIDLPASSAWCVAQFRSHHARHVGEPHWIALVERLHAASDEFAQLWERHDVGGVARSKVKRYMHPRAGLITVTAVSLRLAESPDCRVIVMVPADPTSRSALERLAGTSGAPAGAAAAVGPRPAPRVPAEAGV